MPGPVHPLPTHHPASQHPAHRLVQSRREGLAFLRMQKSTSTPPMKQWTSLLTAGLKGLAKGPDEEAGGADGEDTDLLLPASPPLGVDVPAPVTAPPLPATDAYLPPRHDDACSRRPARSDGNLADYTQAFLAFQEEWRRTRHETVVHMERLLRELETLVEVHHVPEATMREPDRASGMGISLSEDASASTASMLPAPQ